MSARYAYPGTTRVLQKARTLARTRGEFGLTRHEVINLILLEVLESTIDTGIPLKFS